METPTPNLVHFQMLLFLARYITDKGRNEMLKPVSALKDPVHLSFFNTMKEGIAVVEHHPTIQFDTLVVGTDETIVADKIRASTGHVMLFTYENTHGSLANEYAARALTNLQVGVYYPDDPKRYNPLERFCIEMGCIDLVTRIQFEMRQHQNDNNFYTRWMENSFEFVPNDIYDRIGSVLQVKCNPLMYND